MKLEYSRQIFEKHSSIIFNEISSRGSRVVPCKRAGGRTDGRTDRHNIANGGISQFCRYCYYISCRNLRTNSRLE